MMLWWYVPGASISRRRSSGWVGLASSSSCIVVRMPNMRPSTAKLPTASSDDSTPLTTSSKLTIDSMPRSSERLARKNASVSGDHGERDLGARDEVGDQALLAPDGQGADHRADQRDDADFEAPPAIQASRIDSMMPTARASWASMQDGQQHADRGQRENVCPQRAARNDHPGRDGGNQDQARQQHHAPIAIEQRSVEVPDERGQHADQAERQQRRGGDRPPVELGVAQAERFERFDLERPDDLAVADDGLAALVGLLDRRDRLAGVLLGARGRVGDSGPGWPARSAGRARRRRRDRRRRRRD